jgi:hypothetical protein
VFTSLVFTPLVFTPLVFTPLVFTPLAPTLGTIPMAPFARLTSPQARLLSPLWHVHILWFGSRRMVLGWEVILNTGLDSLEGLDL